MSPRCFVSSPSTSSDDEVYPHQTLSATQLLSVAIKKRRSLASQKDRDLRLELLHTGMIQSLCKHLGEGRAKRRRRGKRHSSGKADPVPEPAPLPEPPLVQALSDQEPCSKRCRLNEEDPFGLDKLFLDVYGRVPSGKSLDGGMSHSSSAAVNIVA